MASSSHPLDHSPNTGAFANRAPLGPGETVLHGRFTIAAPMLDEAPGAYFTARDTLTHAEVALRVLLLHGKVDTGALIRLRHDLRRVAASPHPYILRVLDCDVLAGTLLLATEPRGPSLRQMLAARRLSTEEALTYALQLAGALSYIHAHGVAHGRLTPATVIIRDGTARLADVGLCQVAEALADPWPGDLAARTTYLPPEAAYAAFPTLAMDVYHFGALLWELLTGSPPPATTTPLPSFVVLPALAQLITRCLLPTPDQRPASMNEIITVLKATKRGMDGKNASDGREMSASLYIERNTHQETDDHPTAQLAQVTDRLPTMPMQQTVVLPTPFARETAKLPAAPAEELPLSAVDWSPAALPMAPTKRRGTSLKMPTLRMKPASVGKKVALTGGILAMLAALFVITGATILKITYAAPPRPDAVVLRVGVTTLSPRATPYRVTQTLVIGKGRTLRVNPGTTILFAPGASLVVAGGVLAAHGNADAPITFTAMGDVGMTGTSNAAPWGGIQIIDAPSGATSRATLDGVILRAAGDGQTAALTCHSGMLSLLNSTQSDSLGTGVQTDANCWGEVAHTTFVRDLGAAAQVASASLHFHDNTLNGLAVTLP